MEKGLADPSYIRELADKDILRKSGLRWNVWQVSLGLFKDAKTIEEILSKVREKRKLYEKLKKIMEEAMDSYEDPLLHNPLLKVKEEVVDFSAQDL